MDEAIPEAEAAASVEIVAEAAVDSVVMAAPAAEAGIVAEAEIAGATAGADAAARFHNVIQSSSLSLLAVCNPSRLFFVP